MVVSVVSAFFMVVVVVSTGASVACAGHVVHNSAMQRQKTSSFL